MADSFEVVVPDAVILRTPTLWLIGQAFELLNTEGKAAEVAYGQVAELLRGRDDAVESLFSAFRSSPTEDVGRRWCALYVLGHVGDKSAAEPLFRAASESLPKPCKEEEGCEGPRDGEVMIRTMAVAALQRVAERHEEAGELVLALIAEHPERPVLIEAVKAARALNLADKAREALRKEDRWMLDIRIQPVQEVMAQAERGDAAALGHTPPSMRAARTAPAADCCAPRKEG
ncbi:MAG TPA: hypothetical protein VGC25_10715 [Alphaproteobacteria bacterium]